MRVAFMHIGQDLTFPTIMVASVRRHMPDVEVVQMTEPDTPSVPDIDTRVETHYDGRGLMGFRLRFLQQLGDEPFISLDTDVMVQEDMRHVFLNQFDVGLTRRYGQILLNGRDIVPDQPYNAGVIFSRSSAFWREAADYCDALGESERKWFGEQLSIAAIARTGKYKVLELPCSLYNYSPNSEGEPLSDKFALHFKGKRKPWMLNRGRLMGLAARAPGGASRDATGAEQWQTT